MNTSSRARLAVASAAVVAGTTLATGAAPAAAATVVVDCAAGATISAAIASAQPGDTVSVSGTCRETVLVPRRLTSLTLVGQSSASIVGPPSSTPATSPASFTVFVESTGFVLRGFTIVGGAHGVHLSGPATATIEDNVIRESAGAIHLDKGSVGQVLGNTLEDNDGYGINLQEDSYARIGFRIPTLPPVGNLIRNNDGPGIIVGQRSSAWIAGNQLTRNAGDGVVVDRISHADVIGNRIARNGGDGIDVRNGSGLNLDPRGTALDVSGPNSGRNAGVGVRCRVGGFVAGPLGTLNGAKARSRFTRGCVDATTS